MFKKILKGVCIAIAFIVLIPVVFVGYLTVFDKVPPEELPLEVFGNPSKKLDIQSPFTITTFNIGYASLDKDQNFFADGGTQSRGESEEKVKSNLNKTSKLLKTLSSDFYFLQEVDVKARRSYYIDQLDWLTKELSEYSHVFAANYNAIWVPVPLTDPLGDTVAGMMTLSKYGLEQSTRYQLKGQEEWPMRLMELDRCIVKSEIPVEGGKKLVLINLHLSAYDKGGLLRNQQAEHLVEIMNELYADGHYVILGGDFNQLLDKTQMEDPEFMAIWPSWLVVAPESLSNTGYQWAVDTSVNTIRDLATTYVEGKTFETIIDGFLVSPNIEVLSVKGHDLGFDFSDHNPVSCTFKLLP